MKVEKFLAALVIASGVLVSNCLAAENNAAVLADLKQKRADYVDCGAESVSYYVDKNSLNVLKYAPPEYIIAVNLVYHSTYVAAGTNQEAARSVATQFKYDYDDRRIYVKRSDDHGASYWIFVDPKLVGTLDGAQKGWDRDMAAGEIAFFLAYGMSFFEKPVSEPAKKLINSR